MQKSHVMKKGFIHRQNVHYQQMDSNTNDEGKDSKTENHLDFP